VVNPGHSRAIASGAGFRRFWAAKGQKGEVDINGQKIEKTAFESFLKIFFANLLKTV
jgi:hypothetical protein